MYKFIIMTDISYSFLSLPTNIRLTNPFSFSPFLRFLTINCNRLNLVTTRLNRRGNAQRERKKLSRDPKNLRKAEKVERCSIDRTP